MRTCFRYTTLLLVCISFQFILGCSVRTTEDLKGYYKYLSDPDNGLIQQRIVGDLCYRVKYLPGQMLAYNTLAGSTTVTERNLDSVTKIYENSLTFLLTVGPKSEEFGDITRLGVSNYSEYAERIEQMAFNAENWIRLQSQVSEYKPALVKMESINAQKSERNFIVVFNSEHETNNDLRNNHMNFVYTDEIFSTGINKFHFKKQSLASIPRLRP